MEYRSIVYSREISWLFGLSSAVVLKSTAANPREGAGREHHRQTGASAGIMRFMFVHVSSTRLPARQLIGYVDRSGKGTYTSRYMVFIIQKHVQITWLIWYLGIIGLIWR